MWAQGCNVLWRTIAGVKKKQKPDTYAHIGTLEEQHAPNTATESKRSWASVNDVISSSFQQTAKGPFFPPSTDSGNLLGSLRSVTTIRTPAA